MENTRFNQVDAQSPGNPYTAAASLLAQVRLPVIGAPMFIVSSMELVAQQCCAGIVGAFPALNARPVEALATWLDHIEGARAAWDSKPRPWPAAPYAVNLVSHPSNARFADDLGVVCDRRVPIVITSLNPPGAAVQRVHGYGGIVLHDVATLRHARKAVDAGVDGLILVCAGAGGHTGTLNPLAFVDEVRRYFDGLLVVAGCVNRGAHVHALRSLGADMVYMGTRFIVAAEANAAAAYQQMTMDAHADDVVCTSAITGLPANYLRQSFAAVQLDPDNLAERDRNSFVFGKRGDGNEAKAWRDVWSAGQGVGANTAILPAAQIIEDIANEYDRCNSAAWPL